MVLAHHIIFTAYGFWLPNDPRGSWSDWVASWELLKFGPATKTTTRRSVAGTRHNSTLRAAAKLALKHSPVIFSGTQALSIANGFATAIHISGYVLRACSILPNHVHIVVDRHTRLAEAICGHLKSAASKQLRMDGLHPFQNQPDNNDRLPTPWASGCWKTFLNTPTDIQRSINYVNANPQKENKRPQFWKFLTPVN